MDTSEFVYELVPRTQIQMVRVGEHNLSAKVLHLLRDEPLYGPERSDRHERRGEDVAMWRRERATSGSAFSGVECVLEHGEGM